MSTRPDPARSGLRDATLRPLLAVGALLLFVWPLVRTPRLSLVQAWSHLFASWALVIVALYVVLRPSPEPGAAERDRRGRDA